MIIDLYFDIVRDTAQLLDDQMERLSARGVKSADPGSSTEFDVADYICGLGFAALQQYITHVVNRHEGRIVRPHAFTRGPTHKCGQTYAALINAAANYWKHSTEWQRSGVDSNDRARQAAFPLRQLGVDLEKSYVLAHALYKLMDPNPARFRLLVPYVERWRDDVSRTIADR